MTELSLNYNYIFKIKMIKDFHSNYISSHLKVGL